MTCLGSAVMRALAVLSMFIMTPGQTLTSVPPDHVVTADVSGGYVWACAGDTLILPWTYMLKPGETIRDIQWYFHGLSEEMVAIFSHGHFAAMPSFANRVTYLPNAGLRLGHVSKMDTGNYSVEVTVQDAAGRVVVPLSTWVYLEVADGLMTQDGQLHVGMGSKPVRDVATGHWSTEVTCGLFTYTQAPPFTVEFTTGGGQRIAASHYVNGSFVLRLPAPLQGGDYSCRIPSANQKLACVSRDHQATLAVDGVEGRLALMEAKQDHITQENAHLKQEVALLQGMLNNGGGIQNGVSFEAVLSNDTVLSNHSEVLVPDVATHNQGQAYDPITGVFTAPVAGTYFLALATRCLNGVADAEIVTSSSPRPVCRVDSDVSNDAGACQGVTSLAQGDTVWLRGFETKAPSCFRATDTVFSGFLVSRD